MDSFTSRAARIMLNLSLGLWIGALAGFAFFFAPAAFAAMGATPAFGAMVAGIIERLTDFGFICALVAVVALAVLLRGRTAVRLRVATILVVVLMTALSWGETALVVPQMRVTPVRTPAYAGLHHRSSTIYGSVLILGVIALSLGALRRD